MKNIPNILSGWRLLTFPLLLYFIFTGERNLFVWLLCINLVTDILDGLIARTFKLETELGAKLDSFADVGSYIAAFTGMIVLEKDFVHDHQYGFMLMIGMYALPQLVSLVRFKRTTSFHLYSNKITGYICGLFFFSYFVFGYAAWYFYFMLVFACLAYLESFIIVVQIPQLESNLKTVFHWWKGRIRNHV